MCRNYSKNERFGSEYNFGKNLKSVRTMRGLTQKEMSEKLGVHQPNLAGYENDSQKPSIMLLMHFAEICNVDMNELLGHKSTVNTKIHNIFTRLSSHNKKIVTEMADFLLFRQNGGALDLINYNKKPQTKKG